MNGPLRHAAHPIRETPILRRALTVARPYLYLFPTFFFLFIFTHYPILKTFQMSLYKWNLATPGRRRVLNV